MNEELLLNDTLDNFTFSFEKPENTKQSIQSKVISVDDSLFLKNVTIDVDAIENNACKDIFIEYSVFKEKKLSNYRMRKKVNKSKLCNHNIF